MFAPKHRRSPTPTQGKMSNAARDKVVSKLLTNTIAKITAMGAPTSTEVVDVARRMITEKVNAHEKFTEAEIADRVIAAVARKPSERKNEPTSASAGAPARENGPRLTEANLHALAPSATGSVSGAISPLLENTTKKQRQQMADAEWSAAAEQDRRSYIEGRKEERKDKVSKLLGQRSFLDQQVAEHEAQKELERQQRLRTQKEVSEAIEEHRRLTRQEREEAHNRAVREKQFREDQAREQEHQRQLQKQHEHEEQMKMARQAAEELERERQNEIARRENQKLEWKRTLEENQSKQEYKAHEKEREREIDRKFQKEYSDRLDQQDRERMEAMARKAARSAYFQKLANNVASSVMQKEQDFSEKINQEYQEQLRRNLEDEAARKNALRNRNLDCQNTRLRQMAEKKALEDKEREEARQNAARMRQAAEYAAAEEEARKQAAKAEAARLKEFLNTQLQLQHFRETRPPNVSIARPISAAKTMYSQTLFSQSPNRNRESELSA